jgi:uncharacterized protein YecE (DUF72 family)
VTGAPKRRPTLRIGLSGWNYPSWKSHFYAGVPQRDWLAHAMRHFSGLEINATFYMLQKPTTLERWRAAAPPGFAFTAKAHRFATHNMKLLKAADTIRVQKANLAPLGRCLEVLVWQLPDRMKRNLERLDEFGRALRDWRTARHAVEFRHESWFDDEVADCLSRHRIANCISDAADWPRWDAVTTDLVYVRLHGKERTYRSSYSDGALADWAAQARRWRRQDRAVHIYFDNDGEGAAPHDARRLGRLLDPARFA